MRALQADKPVVVVGDLNCAHTEHDVHSPATLRASAGFTDAERENFGRLLEGAQLCDVFRERNPTALSAYLYRG